MYPVKKPMDNTSDANNDNDDDNDKKYWQKKFMIPWSHFTWSQLTTDNEWLIQGLFFNQAIDTVNW